VRGALGPVSTPSRSFTRYGDDGGFWPKAESAQIQTKVQQFPPKKHRNAGVSNIGYLGVSLEEAKANLSRRWRRRSTIEARGGLN